LNCALCFSSMSVVTAPSVKNQQKCCKLVALLYSSRSRFLLTSIHHWSRCLVVITLLKNFWTPTMTIPDLKTGRAITHCTSHSIPFQRYLEILALGANLETMIHDTHRRTWLQIPRTGIFSSSSRYRSITSPIASHSLFK
jgi:hypothetical protein